MKIFKNRLFLATICLVLAALIGFVGVPLINRLSSQTTVVVRVKQDVNMGTQLTEDMLEQVEVGTINLQKNLATNVSDAVGLYVTVDMKEGDYVSGAKVAQKLVLPENKIRQMEDGEATYRVLLGDSSRLRLLPNDIVTFHTYDASGNAVEIPELKYVSVVVTTATDGTEIMTATQAAKDGGYLKAETATFILSDKQMSRLLELERSGNFRITLTYRGSNESRIQRYLTTQKTLLYGSSTSTRELDEGEWTEVGD